MSWIIGEPGQPADPTTYSVEADAVRQARERVEKTGRACHIYRLAKVFEPKIIINERSVG